MIRHLSVVMFCVVFFIVNQVAVAAKGDSLLIVDNSMHRGKGTAKNLKGFGL